MRIISNGVEKEIEVLKHFKINTDEYIIYKDSQKISLGSVVENKIVTPDSEKMGTVKLIISNYISNSFNDIINTQNNCTTLSNGFDYQLEEISSQSIRFTDVQLINLTNGRVSTRKEVDNGPGINNDKTGIIIFLILIIIVLSGILVGLLTNKIKNPLAKSNEPKTEQNSKKETTKKNSSDPIKGIETAYKYMIDNDYDSFMSTMPSAIRDYYKKEISKEEFANAMSNITKEIGTNIKITSNLTTEKMSNEWLEQNNEFIQREFGNKVKMTECYGYKGTLTFKGSKGEKVFTEKNLNETWYCKVNGEWGFIFG